MVAQNTTGVYGVLDAGADFIGSADGLCIRGTFFGCCEDGTGFNIGGNQMIAAKLKEYYAKNYLWTSDGFHKRMRAEQPDAMDTLISLLLPMNHYTRILQEAEKLCVILEIKECRMT